MRKISCLRLWSLLVAFAAVTSVSARNTMRTVAPTATNEQAPAPPAVASLTEVSDGTVKITWEPVTTDTDGNALPENSVTYIVAEQTDYGWVPVIDAYTGLSYTYQAVMPGNQAFMQYAVFADLDGVIGAGAKTELLPIGTPYDGFRCGFPDGTLGDYEFAFSSSPSMGGKGTGGGAVSAGTEAMYPGLNAVDLDNGFLVLMGLYKNESILLYTGKISLAGMAHPAFSFHIYNYGGNDACINEVTLYARKAGEKEWTPIRSATVSELADSQEGWHRVVIPMDDYAGETMQFAIDHVSVTHQYTMMDNIVVGNLCDHDLSVIGITAPTKVNTGEKYVATVKVTNNGMQDASDFNVILYAANKPVATQKVESLKAGDTQAVEFESVMPAIQTDNLRVYAEVNYDKDQYPDNDFISEIEVMPVVSVLPAPQYLAGTTEDGNSLTWQEPDFSSEMQYLVTDDFENGEAFADHYGDWTFVDHDGSPVGGFLRFDIPNIEADVTAGSYWIWDASQLGNATFGAHSGSKYLFSLYRSDYGTSSDWAISPKLPGDAQTISFWAKSYSSSVSESFSVYYSSTDKNVPADFTKIEVAGSAEVPNEWTKYTVDLPEGAKYFAIVCESTDATMLMIDDITYIASLGVGHDDITGYNVYRNGEKLNESPIRECSYIDREAPADIPSAYVVTAVYGTQGESSGSNSVTLISTGTQSVEAAGPQIIAGKGYISVVGAESRQIVVAAPDGTVLYNAPGTALSQIPLASGVYIVRAGNTVRKLTVR